MIDLRSDTVTKPGDTMRDAAHEADVGDDVYGEDPTVNELEERAADLVGKEAALYVPTGTMGNQIAVREHTERGQEVLADRESHVVKWELGGMAQHAAVQVRMVDGERGVPSADQVEAGYVAEDLHRPGTGLLCLENTHNARGGLAIEPVRIAEAADAARERDVAVHLDGARVFNAATALDVDVTDITQHVDSVMFCLSKGLGAPVGSMLAGDADFVERARRTRKLFGGGMRQVGIIAGPGLQALENVDDLEADHDNARLLAAGLDDVAGLSTPEPETNIVVVDVGGTGLDVESVLERLREHDVLATAFGPTTIRFCTHRDVSREDIERAVEQVAGALV
ncbi:low-specificity L-threonine aldolase [Natronosalvus halobius]|uniref:low-specificity L-threonine aldolase n=1 Tax=Natronosalvus halobius TaxID=2953746 RepID=UPI00209C97A7|nr:low-specificity L-threonine aldolase [Natronosalvus halobius]USZ70806.1 low-specificity L-threonine aldolase [Natronosalvus halobius]